MTSFVAYAGISSLANTLKSWITDAMIQFRLFGIPISIHWFFWLIIAYIGGATNLKTAEDFQSTGAFILAALVSILIHEFGHAFVGILNGGRNPTISLHGLGGACAFPPSTSFTKGKRIAMIAAGPGASILLAILFYIISVVVVAANIQIPLFALFFLNTMVGINIFWSIVNLFPVLPLDGGQIVMTFLGAERIKLTCIISFIFIGVLALFLWISTKSIYNMVLMALLAGNTLQVWQRNSSDERPF